MLLDDSLEVEMIHPSNDAALIPMIKWHDVHLSDIWIPSDLLNRQRPSRTSSDVYQSVICRTLQKRVIVDSLSIYPSSEIEKSSFNSSERLLDSLEEILKYTNLEHASLQKHDEEEIYYSSESPISQFDANDSEIIQDSRKVENNTCLEEKYDSPENSIADYLEHLDISDDEEENSLIGTVSEPDKVAIDCSNNEEVLESSGNEIGTKLASDVSMQIDSLYNEVVQDFSTDQVEDIVEISEKLWNDYQQNIEKASAEEKFISSNQTDRIHDPASEQDLEFSQISGDFCKIEDPEEEEIQHFPFLLQKSQDNNGLPTVANNGKSNKKTKKSKKKASKSIPLTNFFVSKEEAAQSNFEYNDFYESLSRKHGNQNTSKESKLDSISASLNKLNQIKESAYPEMLSNSQLGSSSSFDSTLVDNDVKKPFVNSNSTEACTENDSTKYAIENIPSFVDVEMLQSLIVTFGGIEIINIVMEQSGKTLKAILEVTVEEPSWLIECLNDSQPFGAADECLKCYRIL